MFSSTSSQFLRTNSPIFFHLLALLFMFSSLPSMANARPASMDVVNSSSGAVNIMTDPPPPTQYATNNNVSSHVLDIALGQPGAGIACTAYKWVAHQDDSRWELWGETKTNAQGRIPIVHPNQPLAVGQFKLHFHTKKYFEEQQRPTFYPFIEVVFQIDDPHVHYHVPITLSNFGYSTYKGQ